MAVTCEWCLGTGHMMALVDGTRNGKRMGWRQRIDCTTCEGKGEISEEKDRWMKDGRVLRGRRVALGLTAAEYAARLDVDLGVLHACERGMRDPREVQDAVDRDAPGAWR